MKRHQLEHIIRAAAGITACDDIVVIGSQAILGTLPEPPEELLVSMEADVFPKNEPKLSIQIDGAIGELSLFHETFGYYAHGVDPSTAILPAGWENRLVKLENANTRGSRGFCLDLHDLAISKLAAGREKDRSFVKSLLRNNLISRSTLMERVNLLASAKQATLSDEIRSLG